MSESSMNRVEEKRIDGGMTVLIKWGPDKSSQISHFAKGVEGEAGMYMLSGVARMLPGTEGEFKLRTMFRTVFKSVKNKANGQLVEVIWEPEDTEKLQKEGKIIATATVQFNIAHVDQISQHILEHQQNVASVGKTSAGLNMGNLNVKR